MNQQFPPPETRPVDRWILRGEIRLTSALMIRTGEPETRTLRAQPDDMAKLEVGKTGEDAEVYAVELDAGGRPFLPGTALKALARRTLAGLAPEKAEIIETVLFGGIAAQRGGGEDGRADTAIGGRAEFRNAYLIGHGHHLAIRGMTKIDAGTRTAADKMLRHQYVVEPGAAFKVEILLDGVYEHEVLLLIEALRQWREQDGYAVGGGTRQGFGRIVWAHESASLKHWDAAAIVEWLANPGTDWRDCGKDKSDLTRRSDGPGPVPGLDRSFGIEVGIGGYFLVSYATKKGPDHQEITANRRPLTRGVSADGRSREPLLPGTSMKGALRTQSERILRTMLGDARLSRADATVQRLANELYGSTHCAGRIAISDLVGAKAETKSHEMVAIDRFSGGAADGAKFTVDVFEAPTLKGRITLDLDGAALPSSALTGQKESDVARAPLSQAAIGLLALTLRDLRDGDIALGYGTRKGYGDVVTATSGGGDILDALATAVFGRDTPEEERRRLLNDAWSALQDDLSRNQEDAGA